MSFFKDNNPSRFHSASSDISQTTNYISPSCQFIPSSDMESEYDGNKDDHETNRANLFNYFKLFYHLFY